VASNGPGIRLSKKQGAQRPNRRHLARTKIMRMSCLRLYASMLCAFVFSETQYRAAWQWQETPTP